MRVLAAVLHAAAVAASCAPGTFRTDGADPCTQCGVGKFSLEYDATGCTDCAAGQYAVVQSAACSDCPTGQYHYSTGGTCHLCYAGKYSAWVGQTNCYHCPSGKYQDLTGYHICYFCNAGLWTANLQGQTACVRMPPPSPAPTAVPTPEHGPWQAVSTAAPTPPPSPQSCRHRSDYYLVKKSATFDLDLSLCDANEYFGGRTTRCGHAVGLHVYAYFTDDVSAVLSDRLRRRCSIRNGRYVCAWVVLYFARERRTAS